MVNYTARLLGLCLLLAGFIRPVAAETYAVRDKSSKRLLRVVRHYDIHVKQGKATTVAIPALMSFWGETNWQVIKSSKFHYSEEPTKIEITADNRGMPRHNFELTWSKPQADTITVEQVLEVELTQFNTLYTTAKLPYASTVLSRFTDALGADTQAGINPANSTLGPICEQIVKRSRSAEDVVEGVCDWINEKIKFVKGERTSDEALAQRQGSCTPMSRLACAMLRRIGIPCEPVPAKFIGSENGHTFIEVYFPDAGWVFYDLSNGNRGFKSLDCLMTVGWAYRIGTGKRTEWIDGNFCAERDAKPFKDAAEKFARLLHKSPTGVKVSGVTVVAQKPPPDVKVRQRPLRELIMDTYIPPGVRNYTDATLGTAGAK